MSTVTIAPRTRNLLIDGHELFPIGLSDAPPLGAKTRDGRDAWAEVASAGVNFIRTGRHDWSLAASDAQLTAERAVLDAAASHGLHCMMRLAAVGNLPAQSPSPTEQLLDKIVNAVKGHPALGVYYGTDEPNVQPIPADGLIRAHTRLKTLDPNHPVIVNQAPLGSAAALVPYEPAFDITGADIYPVSYPPGEHTDLPNKDISVVGDVTKRMAGAAGGKPVWMTLQIAWSGVIRNKPHPDNVPRFPTLQQERFMAYQAIVDGANGLFFFGGQFTQVMRPRDEAVGWNWTFWDQVLRPLLEDLSSGAGQLVLLAPPLATTVHVSDTDIEVAARQDSTFLYLIAVRRSGTTTSRVDFTQLPRRRNGTPIATGEALFEFTQQPLPPPVQQGHQKFRPVAVAGDAFTDWFGPHDSRIYRFRIA